MRASRSDALEVIMKKAQAAVLSRHLFELLGFSLVINERIKVYEKDY